MKEFEEVLPAISRRQIKVLIQELRTDGKIRSEGARRGTKWHPGNGEVILKTAVEAALSLQVLILQAVADTAVVTRLVKCEAVATSMDSSVCGRPPRSTAVFRVK